MGKNLCALRARQTEVDFVNTPKRDERERAIDENLKKVFEQTLDEGIPDRFKDLLSQLKQQDAERGSEK